MTEHRSTDGDSGDKSFAGRSRAWAELEVEMMEKYGHIPLEQFKTIVSHEMLLRGGEDAELMLPKFSFDILRNPYPLSLDERAKQRAEHLWRQCQPKPSVAELTAEIEKLRDEVKALSTNKSANESTNDGWGSCLVFIFLIVIVLLLIRWILL